MKKNYSLICGIAICFLIYVILSWFVPTATIADGVVNTGKASPVGLFGLVYYPGLTIGTFIQFGLIILAIGGLYGVMAKTGVYSKLVNDFANKLKGKEKLFLIVLIIALALINSLAGVPFALFVIVPFLMAIVLKLGYNRITAVSATAGAILVGSLASTFGYNIAGSASNVLAVSVTTGVLSRFVLLAIVTGLFILFVLGNKNSKIEAKSNNKKTKKSNDSISEESILFLEDDNVSKKSTLPMKILFILTIVIAVVSMYNWNTLLKIDVFESFYESLITIKIGDYQIFKNLLGLTNPFGYWDSYELVGLLIIASLVIGWVYSLKFKDTFTGFVDGAKKLIKPAVYITIANIIFTLMLSAASNGYMLTWLTNKLANITEEFNVFSAICSSLIGGFFYNHFYYLFSSVGQVFTLTSGVEYNAILMFVVQSIYGLVMLILPTSLFLVGGLSLLDVSYKEWIKYIWKFLVEILIIIIVISVILVLTV